MKIKDIGDISASLILAMKFVNLKIVAIEEFIKIYPERDYIALRKMLYNKGNGYGPKKCVDGNGWKHIDIIY